jgi:hypothetical protein
MSDEALLRQYKRKIANLEKALEEVNVTHRKKTRISSQI